MGSENDGDREKELERERERASSAKRTRRKQENTLNKLIFSSRAIPMAAVRTEPAQVAVLLGARVERARDRERRVMAI